MADAIADAIRNGTDAQVVLERIVDAHGLAYTVELLAAICSEKAEHVASNWGDLSIASAWEHNAQRIGRVKTVPTH